jgi:putative peptidoglycan binding protein
MAATYQLHSHGPEVSQIQTALQALALYTGPIDGDFGGGTLTAVKAFQQRAGLVVDGQVGDTTWAALFPGTAIPAPVILAQPLPFRCLALTGTFETSTGPPDCFAGLVGDFDKQGISFGAIQWNFGQDSLQPLLREMVEAYPDLARRIFSDEFGELQATLAATHDDQLTWVRSIQAAPWRQLFEPWQGHFKTLGRQRECQDLQVKHAQAYYDRGIALCATFDVHSERAVALMFDISVQNGGIKEPVTTRIRGDVAKLDPALAGDELEVAKLRIIANRRAEAATKRWIEDVRQRKLAIANGGGTVHGRRYDLEAQYGIRLTAAGL